MEKDFKYYKKAIKDKGLVQSFVAEQIGISGPSLNQRLQGVVELKEHEKEVIDRLLGLTDIAKIKENITDFFEWYLDQEPTREDSGEIIENYLTEKFPEK